jgi:drug/metabolite transporter (DMT)-like permease
MEEFRYIGEVAALATACFWTVSAMSFEVAAKRIGADAVNITRMAIALLFLMPATLLSRGTALPLDAGSHQWFWLGLSGLIGYTAGDFFLFQAFFEVGSRISMLVMASAPAITALIGFIAFGERIAFTGLIGMAFITSGICIVVLKRENGGFKFNHPLRGLLFAFGGAIGQSVGYILSKFGMHLQSGGNYPVLASSQIRLLTGTIGFVVLYCIMHKWKAVGKGLKNKKGMAFTTLGAVAGPVIGVSLSLFAVTHTKAGIASALSSITPILILPFAALVLSEKIKTLDALGAVLAVSGAALMFV